MIKQHNTFRNRFTTTVDSETLRRLYDALEDEATPYEMRVTREGKARHILIDADDISHFVKLVEQCEDEAKTRI